MTDTKARGKTQQPDLLHNMFDVSGKTRNISSQLV